jgi:glycosyltransferase involved in cell wall biosynthesis
MRVAFLVSGTALNGAVGLALEMIRHLAGKGHAVLLLHRPGAWIADQAMPDSVQKVETSFRRVPRELIRVGRLVEAFAPDVAYTHMSSAHAYGGSMSLFGKVPIVASHQAMHFQLHWALNDLVIAVSGKAADYLRRVNRVKAERIRVVPNFVRAERFAPVTPARRQAARAALGVPDDALVIGSVGDIGARKAQAQIVRAAGPLRANVPGLRLVLIGPVDKAYGAELDAALRDTGLADVTLLPGRRQDVPDLLPAFDIFAMSSRAEAHPLAVLEAMATGLPVVATAAGSVDETVIEGETGFVVPIDDVAGLTRGLSAIAGDPARRAAMGEAGRARFLSTYTLDALAPRVEAVLAEAAAKGHRPPLGFIARAFGF